MYKIQLSASFPAVAALSVSLYRWVRSRRRWGRGGWPATSPSAAASCSIWPSAPSTASATWTPTWPATSAPTSQHRSVLGKFDPNISEPKSSPAQNYGVKIRTDAVKNRARSQPTVLWCCFLSVFRIHIHWIRIRPKFWIWTRIQKIPESGSKLFLNTAWNSGLWIRIHFMRIRIQLFFWMRIRIQIQIQIQIQVQVQVQLNQIWVSKTWKIAQKEETMELVQIYF